MADRGASKIGNGRSLASPSKDFGGPVGVENPCFSGAFLAFSPKKTKEERTRGVLKSVFDTFNAF